MVVFFITSALFLAVFHDPDSSNDVAPNFLLNRYLSNRSNVLFSKVVSFFYWCLTSSISICRPQVLPNLALSYRPHNQSTLQSVIRGCRISLVPGSLFVDCFVWLSLYSLLYPTRPQILPGYCRLIPLVESAVFLLRIVPLGSKPGLWFLPILLMSNCYSGMWPEFPSR